jgi:glutathione synthase
MAKAKHSKHDVSIKLGVIMDPIAKIKVHHDSTFAMLLAARARHWQIYYMEQKDLYTRDGNVFANMQELKVIDDQQHWYEFGVAVTQPLSALNVILMRKDPPVDQLYLYTTQLLDLVEQAGVLIVNKPQSLRDFNEKLFINWFPQCCPATLVTHNAKQVRDFLQEHEDIIVKPIYGMGGMSIFRLRKNDLNINVILETLTQQGNTYIMAQKYLPEISKGDKRILLIDGEPIPYAYARFAPAGETRANMAVGGSGKGIALTERDYWICQQIAPTLHARGILFAGIDVIGDYLTEINITSPTCIRELDKEFNLDIAGQLMDCIKKYL